MGDELDDRKHSIASQSPDHGSDKDNLDDTSQSDLGNAESIPKDWKVWTEDETRTLIELYKKCISEFPDLSKKLLFQTISEELKKMGYNKGPERIRNRMKSLRTAYRRIIEYNSKHILKKEFPYLEELNDLYNTAAPNLSDDNESSNSSYSLSIVKQENGYSVSKPEPPPPKKIRLVRASKTVRLSVEAPPAVQKKHFVRSSLGTAKKRPASKKTIFPLFQCGQCYGKFSTSQEMHSHTCQSSSKSSTVNGGKQEPAVKKSGSTPSKPSFTWTGMATLQFLQLLKGYLTKTLRSKKATILEDVSAGMKKYGLLVSTQELNNKWKSLAGNFEKTVTYNKKHQDKKKCAFYNRLTELYELGAAYDMFEIEPTKMTVEVSPFSYSPKETTHSKRANSIPNGYLPNGKSDNSKYDNESDDNHSSNLFQWLTSAWNEWKEIEKRKEEATAERHAELMEILSCLTENLTK